MLPEFPKPEFEDGHKGPIEIAGRRLALWQPFAEHSPFFINTTSKLFLSDEIRDLHDIAEKKLNLGDPAHQLFSKNLFITPEEIFMRASPFHGDIWARDEFAACLALNDPRLEKHFLDNIVKTRRKDGHVATTRLIGGDRAWFFGDEITALVLVWRAKIARMGIALEPEEFQAYKDILDWVTSHVDSDGYYTTGAGTEKSWLDTYRFPKGPITYNQGVYTAALRAAELLGLPLEKDAFEKARNAYNNLADTDGKLQMGRNLPYSDVSALYGEFLANLLDTRVLKTDIAKNTERGLTRDQYGYRVVSGERGEYLSSTRFIRPEEAEPGDYQNGATWPFFDFVAFSVFNNHGIPVDKNVVAEELRTLVQTRNAEYIRNGMASEKNGLYNGRRVDHAWNAACYVIAKKLLSGDEYSQALLRSPFSGKTVLYSESSDRPNSSL